MRLTAIGVQSTVQLAILCFELTSIALAGCSISDLLQVVKAKGDRTGRFPNLLYGKAVSRENSTMLTDILKEQKILSSLNLLDKGKQD